MKALIKADGFLMVQRNGKFASQICPRLACDNWRCCGDWCPLFEEMQLDNGTLNIYLNCAPHRTGFDHVIDERQKQ